VAFPEPIAIRGLKERRQALRDLGEGGQKQLRIVFNDAADRIVKDAAPKVPARSGRARKTVRARSTQTAAKVMGGSKRVPYFAWLDFGGRVGRNKTIERPFLPEGRYIYRSFYANRSAVMADLDEGLRRLIAESGLED
jgi:hypothetical protein